MGCREAPTIGRVDKKQTRLCDGSDGNGVVILMTGGLVGARDKGWGAVSDWVA